MFATPDPPASAPYEIATLLSLHGTGVEDFCPAPRCAATNLLEGNVAKLRKASR